MPNDFVRTEIGIALEHGIPVMPVLVRERDAAGILVAEPLKLLASHDAHDVSDAGRTMLAA